MDAPDGPPVTRSAAAVLLIVATIVLPSIGIGVLVRTSGAGARDRVRAAPAAAPLRLDRQPAAPRAYPPGYADPEGVQVSIQPFADHMEARVTNRTGRPLREVRGALHFYTEKGTEAYAVPVWLYPSSAGAPLAPDATHTVELPAAPEARVALTVTVARTAE